MDPGGGPEGIWLWEGEMTVGAAAPIYFLRSSAEVDGRDAVLRGAGGAVDSAMGGLDLSSVLPLWCVLARTGTFVNCNPDISIHCQHARALE